MMNTIGPHSGVCPHGSIRSVTIDPGGIAPGRCGSGGALTGQKTCKNDYQDGNDSFHNYIF